MKVHSELKGNELQPAYMKPTKARFGILILLFFITAINYIDRASVSIVAPAIQSSLQLNPALLGLIFQLLAGHIQRCKYQAALFSINLAQR